jgi:serine/threonine protein kinase
MLNATDADLRALGETSRAGDGRRPLDEVAIASGFISPEERDRVLRGYVRRRVEEIREKLLGAQVGSYHVLEEIQAGGMGIVFKARQESPMFTREVALKFMLPAGDSNLEERERFISEVKGLAGLSHPNLVPIFDSGIEGDIYYFSMELIDGSSLADLLEEESLPLERKVEIARDVARALAFLHENRVIHRDVKPGNIMVDRNGAARLLDFGIAQFSADPRRRVIQAGTPHYMAPEVVDPTGAFGPIGPGTDIYALGAVLYRLLVGREVSDGEGGVSAVNLQETGPGKYRALLDVRKEYENLIAYAEKRNAMREADRKKEETSRRAREEEDRRRKDTEYARQRAEEEAQRFASGEDVAPSLAAARSLIVKAHGLFESRSYDEARETYDQAAGKLFTAQGEALEHHNRVRAGLRGRLLEAEVESEHTRERLTRSVAEEESVALPALLEAAKEALDQDRVEDCEKRLGQLEDRVRKASERTAALREAADGARATAEAARGQVLAAGKLPLELREAFEEAGRRLELGDRLAEARDHTAARERFEEAATALAQLPAAAGALTRGMVWVEGRIRDRQVGLWIERVRAPLALTAPRPLPRGRERAHGRRARPLAQEEAPLEPPRARLDGEGALHSARVLRRAEPAAGAPPAHRGLARPRDDGLPQGREREPEPAAPHQDHDPCPREPRARRGERGRSPRLAAEPYPARADPHRARRRAAGRVSHRRYPQRPLLPVWFRNVPPAHRLRTVLACPEAIAKLREKLHHSSLLDRLQGLPVNAGSPTIGLDAPPCLPQDVTPVDPVK